jgi:dienelactone hydrolase
MRRAGFPVLVWTVNDSRQAQRLAAAGVAAIAIDYVYVLGAPNAQREDETVMTGRCRTGRADQREERGCERPPHKSVS